MSKMHRDISHMKEMVTIVFVLVLLLLLSACSNKVVKNPAVAVHPNDLAQPVPQQEYRITVGDELDIKFFYNPELNENITVRPDGRISLQLVHEIMAAGRTPAELTTILTGKYAAEIERPEITVIVRSFSTQRVYVDGEVNTPGVLDLVRPLTVLQSISRAGGLKETARINEILVIRRQADNKFLIVPVNLEKAIDGTDVGQDIPLTPYDIVFVPKSPIANLNQWVDQYIRKMIPLQYGIGFGID